MSHVPLGKHLVQIEEDTITVTLRGTLSLDETELLFAEIARIRSTHGYVCILYDAHKSTGVDAAARKRAIAHSQQEVPQLQVAFGCSFLVRAIINMLTRANALLRGDSAAPIQPFASESEARAFFVTEREFLRRRSRF